MKPSDRIEQLAQPIVDEGLRQLRDYLEKSEGKVIIDEDWAEYLAKPDTANAVKQLKLMALLPAIILYLDEQAEGK